MTNIIKDAFSDSFGGLFKKKDNDEEKILKMMGEIEMIKKKRATEVQKLPELPKIEEKPIENHKVEFLIPQGETEEEPKDDQEAREDDNVPLEITTEQRLLILEQNMMAVIKDLDERVTALERFIIKNYR